MAKQKVAPQDAQHANRHAALTLCDHLESSSPAPVAPLRDGTASSPGDRSAAAASVDRLIASALLSLFERAARQPAASLVGAAVVVCVLDFFAFSETRPCKNSPELRVSPCRFRA